MNLITNKLFLIATAIFLIVTLGALWLLYPSTLRQFRTARDQGNQLNTAIATAQTEVTALNSLAADKDSLNKLYDQATAALPISADNDVLLLQLDGLAKSLSIDAAITVPFANASTAPAVAAAPADTSNVKPGSGSIGSAPIITSASSKTEFTIAGKFDFATTLTLLTKLKTFIRWNNITGVDISGADGALTVTIAGQAFSAPGTAKTDLSASPTTILANAQKLFSGYQSYATNPDITTEGSFGRTNPFAP